MAGKPTKTAKQKLENDLKTTWGLPPVRAKQLARTDDDAADGSDIANGLIAHAQALKKKH